MRLKTTCWQNWTCRRWSNVSRHSFASCDVMEYLFQRAGLHATRIQKCGHPASRALPDERERRKHETT